MLLRSGFFFFLTVTPATVTKKVQIGDALEQTPSDIFSLDIPGWNSLENQVGMWLCEGWPRTVTRWS